MASNSDPQNLQEQLAAKEKELEDIYNTFQQIKSSYETLRIKDENLQTQVETLKSSIEMKDTQISTLKDTLQMKDETINQKVSLIEQLKEQIKMKEEQIHAYELTLREKEEKINQLENDPNQVPRDMFDDLNEKLSEKDEEIARLKQKLSELDEEMGFLKEDLEAADDEVEQLTEQLAQLKKQNREAIYLNTQQVSSIIKEILHSALHNVTLTVPSIKDLASLELYDVKPSVNIKVSCNFQPGDPEQEELKEEFQVFDNISLRLYDAQDRWSILQDGEKLFIAVIGEDPNKLLSFTAKDHKIIRLFNSLIMEAWLRAKKM